MSKRQMWFAFVFYAVVIAVSSVFVVLAASGCKQHAPQEPIRHVRCMCKNHGARDEPGWPTMGGKLTPAPSHQGEEGNQ